MSSASSSAAASAKGGDIVESPSGDGSGVTVGLWPLVLAAIVLMTGFAVWIINRKK